MEMRLKISRTVEQNAQDYFERAKKFKKKIPGIKKTIDTYKAKLAIAQSLSEDDAERNTTKKQKKEWFEKFRWFISSDGFLVVGGRDATTNEIMIKKHTQKGDIVFHTDEPGSPFVVITNPDSKQVPESTISQAADFCASFSKQWSAGRTIAQAYWVEPSQVTKEAKSGEYVAKGAFMVYGKRNYIDAKLNIAICNIGRIMAGPIEAVSSQCAEKDIKYVVIVQGDEKLSDVAKRIQRIIGGDIDDIIRSLPQGCAIKR